MEEKDFEGMSQTEKEAACYRLLVQRDKINEELRQLQKTMDKE